MEKKHSLYFDAVEMLDTFIGLKERRAGMKLLINDTAVGCRVWQRTQHSEAEKDITQLTDG